MNTRKCKEEESLKRHHPSWEGPGVALTVWNWDQGFSSVWEVGCNLRENVISVEVGNLVWMIYFKLLPICDFYFSFNQKRKLVNERKGRTRT